MPTDKMNLLSATRITARWTKNKIKKNWDCKQHCDLFADIWIHTYIHTIYVCIYILAHTNIKKSSAQAREDESKSYISFWLSSRISSVSFLGLEIIILSPLSIGHVKTAVADWEIARSARNTHLTYCIYGVLYVSSVQSRPRVMPDATRERYNALAGVVHFE